MPMKPSEVLEKNRNLIREIVARRQLSNPRVYGSVLRGEDRSDSDLDILVDPSPTTTLFTLGGVQWELEEALGVSVDVKVPGDFPPRIRERILAEALTI
jgi:predicted nucleotidyltransferase